LSLETPVSFKNVVDWTQTLSTSTTLTKSFILPAYIANASSCTSHVDVSLYFLGWHQFTPLINHWN